MRGALSCLVGLVALTTLADDTILTGAQIQERWHERMSGRPFIASIEMTVDLGGMRERRSLTVHRHDEDTDSAASERVLIRFEAPASLRKLGLLYFEHDDRPNDYFLYRPSVRRVRRLQEAAVTDNLYGIDPEFLGFGIARSQPVEIDSWERAELRERAAYRLVEQALAENRRFERRTVWIDAETFIPLRTEHELDGELVLVAETLEIRSIQGIPTPVRMRFERPLDKTRAELIVVRVDYEVEIPEETFSIFALTRSRPAPPAQ